MRIRIAIDGPSGAGKSSIAMALAKKLGLEYVDTGALYRSVALLAKEKNLVDDLEGLVKEVENSKIEINKGNVIINGRDFGEQIRSEEISKLSSKLSKEVLIRNALLTIQKDLANNYSLVMEGRDIGSVVIPQAEYKFYLTASPEIRSKRRYDQLVEKGQDPVLEEVYKDIMERDHRDKTRSIAPLVRVEDAIIIDSGNLTEEEVLEKMFQIVKESMDYV